MQTHLMHIVMLPQMILHATTSTDVIITTLYNHVQRYDDTIK